VLFIILKNSGKQQYNPQGVIVVKTNITTTAYLLNLFKTLLEKKIIDFSQQQLIVIDEEGVTIKINN
jgi:hypothetical protein